MGEGRAARDGGQGCPTDVDREDDAGTRQESYEERCARAARTVARQPEHREIYIAVLQHCDEAKAERELEAFIQNRPEYAYETQSPYYLIQALVRAGALDRLELDEEGDLVTPERKAGLSEDEADDLVWSIAYQSTDAGMAVAQDMSPQARMEGLLEGHPSRGDTYRDVLEYCLEPRSRMDVERLLRGRQVLVDEAVDGKPLMPSVFLDSLERSGALVWEGAWVTTEAGQAYLESCA